MANNLLLVDESPLIQRVVELTLEGKDVSIHSAEDADEALSLARSLKPDIVLASTEFKGGGGLDFCRTLQEDPELAGTPVLLLASAKEGLSEEEAKQAGAVGVLTKPFEPENLLAEVGKALSWSDEPGEPAAEEAGEAKEEGAPSDAFEEELAGPAPMAAEEEFFPEDEFPDPPAAELEGGAPETGGEELLEETPLPPLEDIQAAGEAPLVDETMSGETPEEPQEESPPAGEGDPLEEMGLDEFLEDFDSASEGEVPASLAAAAEEEGPSGEAGEEEPEPPTAEEEFDPTMLAIEHTLADEFESLADEATEESKAPPEPTDMETDPKMLADETSLLDEIDSLVRETPAGEADIEAAEAEIADLQAEIAADFEGAEGEAESELDNLADDQVRAAEEELASLQEELETEIDTIEPAGEPPAGAEQLLEEAVFLETGTPEEAELDLHDDEAFWENLEIEADAGEEALPESPEIYAVPSEGGGGERAPGEDAFFEAELTSPLLGEAAGEDGEEDFSENILSPEGDLLADEVAPLVEQSLERTVEAIVPAILKRIESLVVEQLPGMVEKIVLREIEKIKRGE